MQSNITLICDLSKTLLFPTDNHTNNLNQRHQQLLSQDPAYPFHDHFYLNQEFLEYLKTIPKNQLVIFTTGIIQNHHHILPHLEEVFSRIYTVSDVGYKKDNPQAYRRLAQILKQSPHHLIFIDDSQSNIEAAIQAGLRTHHFTNTKAAVNYLKRQ